jgi:inward rectifier potassium channel
MSPEEFAERDAEILVLLTGTDETFSQTVHSRSSYKPGETVWNVKFRDILQRHSAGNPASIDVRRLHEFDPV